MISILDKVSRRTSGERNCHQEVREEALHDVQRQHQQSGQQWRAGERSHRQVEEVHVTSGDAERSQCSQPELCPVGQRGGGQEGGGGFNSEARKSSLSCPGISPSSKNIL